MEVIRKTFAGVARAGRCCCVCRASDDSYGSCHNTGYNYTGCSANCYPEIDYCDQTNWNSAINNS